VVSDEKGQKLVITDSAALNKGSRHAVASVKEGTKGIEVKLYDKIKALEMLGRIVGLYTGTEDDSDLLDSIKEMLLSEDG